MSIKISLDYSSVVLNQNQAPSGALDITDGAWRYQEFFLPTSLARGDKVPNLSGLQIFGKIPSGNAEFSWTLEVRSFGVGWEVLAQGVQATPQDSGDEVWGTVYFSGIDISEVWQDKFRIGISATSGLQGLWYSAPNPLANQFTRATDAKEIPLLTSGNQYSFCFRILGLTAEEGTDFLGNKYRSMVITNGASSTDSVNGNPNQAWMSKPNPSRFAVESLYFDLRPKPDTPRYGLVNYIKDPNGEGAMAGLSDANGATHSSTHEQAAFRNTSIKITAPSVTDSYVEFTIDSTTLATLAGQTVYFSYSTFHASSYAFPATTTVRVGGVYQPSGATQFVTVPTSSLTKEKWIRRALTFSNVDGTKNLIIRMDNQGTGAVYYGGLMLTTKDHNQEYHDGGFSTWSWANLAHGSESIQHLDIETLDEPAVVDRVLIDPQTPGIWCSIYFSNDGQPGDTNSEWDAKNWTRVNLNFNLKERQSYALPEPVSAKYFKLEFTHLQPQQYSPGNFTQSISYKKHSLSVVQYFMARLTQDSQTRNKTVANKVGVTYNALDLLYNYYLDDLSQEPVSPSKALVASSDLEDLMDVSMLGKISTSLNPYLESTQGWDSGSILGELSLLNKSLGDYPTEEFTAATLQDKSDYTSIQDENVAFESDYPVMFFYLVGPHVYRDVDAQFSYNRAYFAGIREVAFLRDRYTSEYDSQQYLETGNDSFNSERSEFSSLDGRLVVPD